MAHLSSTLSVLSSDASGPLESLCARIPAAPQSQCQDRGKGSAHPHSRCCLKSSKASQDHACVRVPPDLPSTARALFLHHDLRARKHVCIATYGCAVQWRLPELGALAFFWTWVICLVGFLPTLQLQLLWLLLSHMVAGVLHVQVREVLECASSISLNTIPVLVAQASCGTWTR